jgi:hypothetical protein
MKIWQKLGVGLGLIGLGYNFIMRYDSLPYYQLLAVVVGAGYIIKQFRK